MTKVGVGGAAGGRRRRRCSKRSADSAVRVAEIRMIEKVEDIDPKLNLYHFRDREVLHSGKVPLDKTWRPEGVTPNIANGGGIAGGTVEGGFDLIGGYVIAVPRPGKIGEPDWLTGQVGPYRQAKESAFDGDIDWAARTSLHNA